jgi:ribosomal protein L15
MMSKANKHRGRCRTHGRGHKAGRGAGKRGGRGNAGMIHARALGNAWFQPRPKP